MKHLVNHLMMNLNFFITLVFEIGGKMDFDYLPNPNHYVKFGLSDTYHTFYPGQMELRAVQPEFDESIDTSFVFSDRLYSHDAYVYLEDDIKFNDRFKAI